ncbi:family 1 encapsulin nanocompartment shell protein [Acidomonas methanolica]|uniref:Linocin M18 bacteriocin protein n=3 Tax=Acidomonas methanolica TaxID=437 RepID=A0A023D3M2_ACIMT|nr:family 1 encapsulin nanocompartment shell protein [Acidomonas methanolica]MBU2654187.1 bacteriocin family protein [Acidomonas methanolica]TCS30583.1 putative linocin/CFP29 family protein [Acidomonas methanolica]GAJ28375.1 linocin M18 bacteriocin protein [Acidomonas methanolica NBRC 104435]GEK98859.1 putative 29 kDa antigen CFP29 (Bacteriocin CFP29) [Acidomonas methanolica NBRC 104435]
MNNLHRHLAPVSRAAWEQIEDEASRTIRRHLAGRRMVDTSEPHGLALAGIGTGRGSRIDAPAGGVRAVKREILPLVELRVPFTLSREEIDAVDRGSQDSDWQPVKDAAKTIAFAEDRAIFDGYAAAGIRGIREATSNPRLKLPASVQDYPRVIAEALNTLRLAGVNGPYSVVFGAQAFLAVSAGDDDGYPVRKHIESMIDGKLIWAPAIEGAFVVTMRGGDLALDIGQDISIGYLSHTADTVELYLQESFVFRVLTSEATVAISAADTKETSTP